MDHSLPIYAPLEQFLRFSSALGAVAGFAFAAFYYKTHHPDNYSKAAGALFGGIICTVVLLLSLLGVV